MTTPEPDPIAELLARVAAEHQYRDVLGDYEIAPHYKHFGCSCGWEQNIAGMSGWRSWVAAHHAHLAEVQAAALRDAGHVVDAAAEVEWAVVDRGRTIHIEGATCPADVLAGAHGHGATQVGVAHRTVARTPWQPINHGQENP